MKKGTTQTMSKKQFADIIKNAFSHNRYNCYNEILIHLCVNLEYAENYCREHGYDACADEINSEFNNLFEFCELEV